MSFALNLYSSSQARELDRIAIDDFGILGITLMKRAGQATFNALIKAYPATKSLCVVCGTGNNGGDGYIIAMLASNAGLKVSLIQLGNEELIKADALSARNEYLKTGAKGLGFDEELLNVDMIVDAIFGTGLSREVEGDWAQAIDAINQNKAKVIAVDVPSGLNSDTGMVLGTAVKADLTVTYIGIKSGLHTGQARDFVGKLFFDDLNIPQDVYKCLPDKVSTSIIPENILEKTLQPRLRCSHKGAHGYVLFIGGSPGMSGAIRLAAEAGLRSGAGLVSVATDATHADYLNNSRPELMVSGVQDAQALLPLIEKASVIAIGPGLGKSDWAKKLLLTVIKSEKPKVLDADALNLLADDLLEKTSLDKNNWILTPHPAEAARLLKTKTKLIEQDRYQSISKLQKKWGGVCLLKGAGSLISNGVNTRVCIGGNPGMASGGMGDVLTGVIAALLAQGLSLFDAATAGVYLHAKAADLAAQKGERGMLASDLFPYLRALGNNKQP